MRSPASRQFCGWLGMRCRQTCVNACVMHTMICASYSHITCFLLLLRVLAVFTFDTIWSVCLQISTRPLFKIYICVNIVNIFAFLIQRKLTLFTLKRSIWWGACGHSPATGQFPNRKHYFINATLSLASRHGWGWLDIVLAHQEPQKTQHLQPNKMCTLRFKFFLAWVRNIEASQWENLQESKYSHCSSEVDLTCVTERSDSVARVK